MFCLSAYAGDDLVLKVGMKFDDAQKMLQAAGASKTQLEWACAGSPCKLPYDYEIPDNFSEEVTNDEFFQWWANHSFENGYGQAEFAKGLEMFEKAVSQTAPDFDAEMKKLGDNANARVEAAALFARQFFPEEQMPAVERLTETAEGLMELPADAPVGTDIRDYLELDDVMIELSLTPNRADCFSIAGIARVAGITGIAGVTSIIISGATTAGGQHQNADQ